MLSRNEIFARLKGKERRPGKCIICSALLWCLIMDENQAKHGTKRRDHMMRGAVKYAINTRTQPPLKECKLDHVSRNPTSYDRHSLSFLGRLND